ncbi:TPA: AraC family transcriptional regulator, partial [Vibrio cholerae]
ATGEMPQVVIDLWNEVWNYFASEHCPHERAYTTDFEYYKSANSVEISIAVR